MAVTMIGGAAVVAAARAQPPEGGITWQAVYVPSESTLEEIAGRSRLVPMKAAEFRKLVDAAAGGELPRVQAMCGIAKASYEGKLVGNRQIRGRGTWQIRHSGGGPQLLPLEIGNTAILAPKWNSDAGREVALGTTETGKLALLVEAPGELAFEWAIQTNSSQELLVFDVTFPQSLHNKLVLSLPDSFRPIFSGEYPLVSQWSDGNWEFDLGGNHDFQLGLARQTAQLERRIVPSVAPRFEYTIRDTGIDLECEFHLSSKDWLPPEFEFVLSPQMRPLAAYVADKQVRFVEESVESEEGAHRITVPLANNFAIQEAIVRLRVILPAPAGNPVSLVQIRALGMDWRGGNATILVQEPLWIERLNVEKGRQSNADRDGAIAVQLFEPSSWIDLTLGEEPTRLAANRLVQIEARDSELQAVLFWKCRILQGEPVHLAGDILPDWDIHLARLYLPDRIDPQWSISTNELPQDDSAESRQLKITLPASLPREDNWIMEIHARRAISTSSDEEIDCSDLQPVRLRNVQLQSGHLAIVGVDRRHVRYRSSTVLPLATSATLDAELREMARLDAGHTLLDADRIADQTQIAFPLRMTGLDADVEQEVVLASGSIKESYAIQISPRGPRLDQILVRFSPARSNTMSWSLVDQRDTELIVTRLKAEQLETQNIPAEDEVWRIMFHPSISNSAALRAGRTSQVSNGYGVSLAGVLGADHQRGSVIVRTAPGASFRIENDELQRQFINSAATQPNLDVNSRSYRYDPVAVSDGRNEVIRLEPDPENNRDTPVIAWDFSLEGHWLPSGSVSYHAVCRLERDNHKNVAFQIPSRAHLRKVWVDGKKCDVRKSPGGNGGYYVPLPTRRRYVVLEFNYEQSLNDDWYGTALTWTIPTFEFPIVHAEQYLWLPETFSLLSPSVERIGATSSPDGESFSFQRWLQGWYGIAEAHEPAPPVRIRTLNLRAQRLVTSLGEAVVRPSNPTVFSWKDFCDAWQQRINRSPPPGHRDLLVDAQSTAVAGIHPHLEIGQFVGETPLERGRAFMQSAGLALLIDNSGTTYLTTLDGMRRIGTGFQQLAEPFCYVCTVRDRINDKADSYVRFVPVDSWSAGAAYPAANWPDEISGEIAWLQPAGWRRWNIRRVNANEEIRVAPQNLVTIMTWSAFLASLALGWFTRRRPYLLLSTCIVGGAIATVGQDIPAMIFSGVFWGLALSLIAVLIAPRNLHAAESCSVIRARNTQ